MNPRRLTLLSIFVLLIAGLLAVWRFTRGSDAGGASSAPPGAVYVGSGTLPKFDQVFDSGHFHGVLGWSWLDANLLVASASTGSDLSMPIPPAKNGPVREDYFPFEIRFVVYGLADGSIRELEIPGRTPGWIVRLDGITQDGLLAFSESERVFHPGDGLPVEPSAPNAWKPLGAFRN
jgi:hypothetical protein